MKWSRLFFSAGKPDALRERDGRTVWYSLVIPHNSGLNCCWVFYDSDYAPISLFFFFNLHSCGFFKS